MQYTFFCIDGHTAGNPVRLVAGGAPLLKGNNMSERRQDFLKRFDWIRTGLCFEPRGHDMMSGGFLYPPTQKDTDAGILFIETSGCLPMCGHGTIGLVTFGLEHGLLHAKDPGKLKLEVPAGIINIEYTQKGNKITSVSIHNIPAFVEATGIKIDVPELGSLKVDIAYGGNFYAIIEPQENYKSIDQLGASAILKYSPIIRSILQKIIQPVHPLNPTIKGVSHVLWTDPQTDRLHGRNAVFYGEKAIDRSPCGTGTSARLAHLWSKKQLTIGESFTHESFIHSKFIGSITGETKVGNKPAIFPLITGSAISTGFNTIWISEEDSFHKGFQIV